MAAEAVWCMWLPRDALTKLATHDIQALTSVSWPWASVMGPARAFVASAQRLGWRLDSALVVHTDVGMTLDFCCDSPAFVRSEVKVAVRRWRWRNVEEKIPALRSGTGGHGAHIHPIFGLLQARPSANWGPQEQGALRSVISNRQWPQARLYSAGKVASRNCRLCVELGHCSEADTDQKHCGTLLHRAWTCPATQELRQTRWFQIGCRRKSGGPFVLTARWRQPTLPCTLGR